MTYSTSQAQAGRGTTLSVGSTPTLIGEIRSIVAGGNSWESSDTTNFQSGIFKEFLMTILDSGDFTVTCNRVSGDAGQAMLESAFEGANAGLLQTFAMVLPKTSAQTTSGDSIAFKGYVQSSNISIETTKEISQTLKIKVSAGKVVTLGT